MAGGFWNGLVGGFSEHRESTIARKLEEDKARRASEAKVFDALLSSNDPEMQQLALAGLLESGQPGRKKGGLAGYLGELQSGQMYPQVQARAAEWIPDTASGGGGGVGGGPSPPKPGSAAMSTNVPVEAGSRPIQLPGQPLGMEPEPLPQTDYTTGAEAAMPPDQEGLMGPPAAMPMGGPPAPPPESKWKRRGTGVPTAEEIAEMQARVPLQARLKMAEQVFAGNPEMLERVRGGVFGAPQSSNRFDDAAYGMKLPDGQVVPITINRETGHGQLLDGTPIPPGAQRVQMTGGAGAGAITTKIPDDARGREYLLSQGADPNEIAGGSPTGYWKLVTRSDGTVSAQADVYNPAPAYTGTTVTLDDQGVPVRSGINRGGGLGAPLGDVPDERQSPTQLTAQGLKDAVDAYARNARITGVPMDPAQLNQYVAEQAQRNNPPLPFRTYGQLTQAIRATPPITPRQQQGGGTLAERVRARALANRAGTATPPPQPPIRGAGPGPGPRP